MNIEERLAEIKARLEEIREMADDEGKRGKVTFKELEKEILKLREEREELEVKLRLLEDEEGSEERNLGDYNPGRNLEDKEEVDEVRAFNNYLNTRDIEEDGLKTDEGYVVVPEEENENIIELADDVVSLKKFVTVKKVSTPSGKQPVRTTAKAKLQTIKELAESPAIGVTPFTEVPFDVETKRGYIPYSEEYKQDGINLENDLKQFIGEVVVNTENDDILEELDTVREKTVNTVDELKTLINTGFSAGKKNKIKAVMSKTVFDNLDRVKDKNGRYLLQESVTAATGYKLLGKDIEVLDDEYFPTAKTMFVGDLKEIIYFDRSQVRVQWTNYLHFGECLGVAIRNDVNKIEDEETKVNIYKVEVDIPTEAEVEETP